MKVIIIGAGPTGLTTAWRLASRHEVVILEAHDRIGGAHRNWEQNGVFSEHSVRVYSKGYKEFETLLKEIGTSYEAMFAEVFTSSVVSPMRFLQELYPTELLSLLGGLATNSQETLDVFTKDFSAHSREYIDWVARVVDGGDLERMPLSQIRALLTQSKTLALPRQPLSDSLFPIWQRSLEQKGVNIYLNTAVTGVQPILSGWDVHTAQGRYKADAVVLAIPPLSVLPLLPDPLPKFERWAQATEYTKYTAAVFYWEDHLDLPKHPFTVMTKHKIVFVIMPFSNGTTISVSATKGTPTQEDIWKELKESLPNLPNYDKASYNNHHEPSFFKAANEDYIKPDYLAWHRLFTVGTHNGYSHFPATSIESAVSNANEFSRVFLASNFIPG